MYTTHKTIFVSLLLYKIMPINGARHKVIVKVVFNRINIFSARGFHGHYYNIKSFMVLYDDNRKDGGSMGEAGSIVFGIIITFIAVGFIIFIVRLIIAFVKVFLVIAIIVAVILFIVMGVNALIYAWQHYIWTDFGRTVMIWAAIGIAGLIILRVLAKRHYKIHETEIKARRTARDLKKAAKKGLLNIQYKTAINDDGEMIRRPWTESDTKELLKNTGKHYR